MSETSSSDLFDDAFARRRTKQNKAFLLLLCRVVVVVVLLLEKVLLLVFVEIEWKHPLTPPPLRISEFVVVIIIARPPRNGTKKTFQRVTCFVQNEEYQQNVTFQHHILLYSDE